MGMPSVYVVMDLPQASYIFPQIFRIFLDFLHSVSSNTGQAPVHVRYTWHPCVRSHATPPVPPSLTWLMRHQPALITCLHSRPCFWTLGLRPLSIVPTISVPFRYRTILVNSPIGPRTHLASPLLSPHCSLLIPNRFSHCPVIVVLLFSLIPLFRLRTMAPVVLLFGTVYIPAL